MPEIKEKNLITQSEEKLKNPERERERGSLEKLEKETISYPEFIEISKKIIDRYEKEPHYRKLHDNFPEIIDRTVEFFSKDSEEIQELVRKILTVKTKDEYDKLVFLLKEIEEETLKILKEKINKWIERILIIVEDSQQIEKDISDRKHYLRDYPLNHFWLSTLCATRNILKKIEK